MLSTLLPARIRDKRIVVAGVLAAFLVVFFVVVAIAQGIGNPSVPSGDVAVASTWMAMVTSRHSCLTTASNKPSLPPNQA